MEWYHTWEKRIRTDLKNKERESKLTCDRISDLSSLTLLTFFWVPVVFDDSFFSDTFSPASANIACLNFLKKQNKKEISSPILIKKLVINNNHYSVTRLRLSYRTGTSYLISNIGNYCTTKRIYRHSRNSKEEILHLPFSKRDLSKVMLHMQRNNDLIVVTIKAHQSGQLTRWVLVHFWQP